jgi:hypothetical protein
MPPRLVHQCHCPSCTTAVPPRLFGCRPCWSALPKRLRDAIWDAYVPGQEARKDPSAEYLAAAHAATEWLREHHQHASVA